MKQSILCLCVIGIVSARPIPATACDMASRTQLFPVGTMDGDLLALKVEQYRGSDSPMGPVEWGVLSELVRIDKHYDVTVLKTFKRRKFGAGDHEHQTAVRGQLRAALDVAQKLRGFASVRGQGRHEWATSHPLLNFR